MSNDRHPRTLQEAFGPYTSRDIHAPEERYCFFRALLMFFRRFK